MIWYFYFTKIRPWIQILLLFSALGDYLSDVIGLVCFSTELILELVLFFKSFNKSPSLLGFIKTYLIVNLFIGFYNVIVSGYYEQYDDLLALSTTLISFIIWYFLWYRLNVGYFRRRLVQAEPEQYINYYVTYPAETQSYEYNSPHSSNVQTRLVPVESKQQAEYAVNYSEEKQSLKSAPPHFCTECGAKLSEGSKFCHNCGTKVM